FVDLPVQVFASGWLRFEHSLKSCGSAPLFVILNTMKTRFTGLGATTKGTSAGFPAVTVTFATLSAPGSAIEAGAAAKAATASKAATITGVLVMMFLSTRSWPTLYATALARSGRAYPLLRNRTPKQGYAPLTG